VLAVLGVLGGGVYLYMRRKWAEEAKRLASIAQERGWRLENVRAPLEWGLRITSSAWRLEALSRSSGAEAGPGSSNVAMTTRWQAERPGSMLLLGPRSPGAGLTGSLMRPFVGMLAGEDLVEVSINHAALRERFMLWAKEPAGAKAWQTPALEAALLGWKKSPPLIRRDGDGLQIEIRGERLKKTEDLLAFIRIGEALLEAGG
jgi:hypothetical protein